MAVKLFAPECSSTYVIKGVGVHVLLFTGCKGDKKLRNCVYTCQVYLCLDDMIKVIMKTNAAV